MYFIGLSKADRKKLETDVVSNDARLRLTRLVRQRCETRGAGSDGNVELINRNHFINTARTVLGLPIYRLEPDDMGMYMSEEFGWHSAETELIMRRPDTAQLVEILGDMLQQGMLDLGVVNDILAGDNSSIRFVAKGFDEDISINILSDAEIDEDGDTDEHPNIRVLVGRMETAFDQKDYAGVLHASATVFETLAKLVIGNPKVEDQTLGGMFEGYRKRSELPGPLLDYILETYRRRNSEPLAGHGATKPPSVTPQEASILIEMTKMCVRLERRLAVQEIDSVPTPVKDGAGKWKATPSNTRPSAKRQSAVDAPESGKKTKKTKKTKKIKKSKHRDA